MTPRTLQLLQGLDGLLAERPSLTVKQLQLLVFLYKHAGAQRIELAKALGLTDGGVTRIVRGLSKEPAWVANQGVLVVLTDAGRALIRFAFRE